MQIIKKILFPLFSLFLLYQSVLLMKQVMSSKPDQFAGTEVWFIAGFLVLCITGIFAFPGFAYPTNRLIPLSYYKIKNPKRLKLFYRILGVNYFRIFLLVFFWGWKKNRRKYFDGTRGGIKNFIYQSKQSEFGHLAAFITISLASVILLFYKHLQVFLLLVLLNVVANLYPVILQRYHRIRIEKIGL